MSEYAPVLGTLVANNAAVAAEEQEQAQEPGIVAAAVARQQLPRDPGQPPQRSRDPERRGREHRPGDAAAAGEAPGRVLEQPQRDRTWQPMPSKPGPEGELQSWSSGWPEREHPRATAVAGFAVQSFLRRGWRVGPPLPAVVVAAAEKLVLPAADIAAVVAGGIAAAAAVEVAVAGTKLHGVLHCQQLHRELRQRRRDLPCWLLVSYITVYNCKKIANLVVDYVLIEIQSQWLFIALVSTNLRRVTLLQQRSMLAAY